MRGPQQEDAATLKMLGFSAARGAAATVGGQSARIVVQFLGLILLARLLTPDDYGLLAMVMALVGLGEVFRDFGLSSAAVQAETLSKDERDNLFWVNTALGFALACLVFFASSPLAAFYEEPRLAPITQVLALSFLISGLSTQYRAGLNRSLRLGMLSAVDLGAQVAGLFTALMMAYRGMGYWALVGQQLMQHLIVLILAVGAERWLPGLFKRRVPVLHFLRFGSHLMLAQLMTYLSRNVDTVVIGRTLGPVPLGLYNRAFQLLVFPLNQLNAPSMRVALPVLSRLHRDTLQFNRFLLAGQTVMVHAMVAIFAFSIAQAQPLISLILGPQWVPSIPIFQILAISGIFQVAGYATYWAYLAKGLTRAQLSYAFVARPLLVISVIVGANWGLAGVAWAYSAGMAALWPFNLWWLSRRTEVPAREMLRNGLRGIVAYSICGIVSFAATSSFRGSYVLELLAGMAGMLSAGILLTLIWKAFRKDLLVIARVVLMVKQKAQKHPETDGVP